MNELSTDFIYFVMCPNCSTHSVVYDVKKLAISCAHCGYKRRKGKGKFSLSEDVSFDIRLSNYFDNYGKMLVGEKLTTASLKRVYSTFYQYKREHILIKNDEVDYRYDYDIHKILMQTKKYQNVIDFKPNYKIPPILKNVIIENEILFYLESIDELPIFASNEQLANYINAPIKLIEKINIKQKENFILQLPCFSNLFVLFHKKLELFYKEKLNDPTYSCNKNFTNQQVDFAFLTLSARPKPNIFQDEFNIMNEMLTRFSKEFCFATEYRLATENSKNEIINDFIEESKRKKWSRIDTIALIMKHFLGDLLE